MKSKILDILKQDFHNSQYIRIQENDALNLYVGKDSSGLYAFEFRGHHKPSKIVGSQVIVISQFKADNYCVLRFSLENPDLLEYFCTLCEDLVSSTVEITEDNIAYRILTSRYFSWKKLFQPNKIKLTEYEVMGLIGELTFMQDYMFPKYGVERSLDSWTGPEATHKDFSLENEWYEVKTLSSGKSSVRISSLEQLDSDINGTLVVFGLEKMSPSFNGLKVNNIVNSILKTLNPIHKELFLSKLSIFGYEFLPEYDNYVYAKVCMNQYQVSNVFPRLTRKNIPTSIEKVQYDIVLSDLEQYKL